MPNLVAPAQTSFNAGELSPYWAARVDMAKYGNGCHLLRNFVPIPQGPARRRMGTRHVTPNKDGTKRTWLSRFIFSEDDSYVLEFGDNYIRFYTGNGQLRLASTPPAWDSLTTYAQGDLVSDGGVNYYAIQASTNQDPPNATYWWPLTGDVFEIWSPYTLADLTNPVDGTFRLSMVQSGDVIFMAHPSQPSQKLQRFGTYQWSVVPASIRNGPFEDLVPDQTVTVYASAATGTGITLTASAPIFDADMVGTLFRIEQKKIDGYKVWEVGKTITAGAERRSDSNVYEALNSATTGSVKPTHREGAKFDGDTGVQWEYLHSGYGIVRITGVGGGGTTATADVVSRIPSEAVGSGNATTRWAKAAWRESTGYPSLVTIFRERLVFFRGQQVWGSVAADFEDFADRDGAETLPDSAFSITIGTGETNAAVWAVPKDALLVGTRGAEFSISEITSSEVFGPGNIKAVEETKYGSRQVVPVQAGDSVLFVQRSGRIVRDMRFSFNTNGYESMDLMVMSDHIAEGQITQMTFALEPSSTMWACCQDGRLIALAYQLEQDVIGWHPHEIGGGSGASGRVESVVTIPSPDGTHDRLWLQVYRVINGQETRFIEYMERDWYLSQQPLEQAVYSDSAATFDGTVTSSVATIGGGTTWAAGEAGTVDLSFALSPGDVGDYLVLIGADGSEAKVRIDSTTNPADVTFITTIPASLRNTATNRIAFARDVIGGLSYLEGEEVTLTVNGAAHPRRTVSGGQITLQKPASVVQVGLPADAELITMRIEAGSANGTSQGKVKRFSQVVLRLHESLGGRVGPVGYEETIEYRNDDMPMDEPPPVLTGDYLTHYDEGYTTTARLRVSCNQPLPFTLLGLYPRMTNEDRA